MNAARPRHREPSNAALGAHLRAARHAHGLSIRAVQTRTGITHSYVSQIENNANRHPSPHILFKLAELYGLDYPHVLHLAGQPLPEEYTSPAGVPIRTLIDLSESEAAQLRDFIATLHRRRASDDTADQGAAATEH